MLVLSRKKNESIVINDNITVVVIEVRGDKVRLGIEAPKDVPVHRKEIYNAIQLGEKRGEFKAVRTPEPASGFSEVAAEVEKTLTPNLG
ncbi:MAG: carbon storage regulator CsrA [Thermoguttaceae bacterium]|jgi:carbon storage regulator